MASLTLTLSIVTAFSLVSGDDESRLSIDGGWSPWSTAADARCTRQFFDGSEEGVTCDGGTMTKVRSCTNPMPQGPYAKPCRGESSIDEPCNTQPCKGWTPWSECSATCGKGTKVRYMMCWKTKSKELRPCPELVGYSKDFFTHTEDCNAWDKTTCPSPCEGYSCAAAFAKCVDISDEVDAKVECVCPAGRIMNDAGDECVIGPDFNATSTPEPIPIPTLGPGFKTAEKNKEAKNGTIMVNHSLSLGLLWTCVLNLLFLYFSYDMFHNHRRARVGTLGGDLF